MGTVIGLTQHQQHWVILELKVPHHSLYDAEKSWLDYLQILAHRCRAQSERKGQQHHRVSMLSQTLPKKSTDSCKKAMYTFIATLGTQDSAFFWLFFFFGLIHSPIQWIQVKVNCGFFEGILKDKKLNPKNRKNPSTYSSKWKSVEIKEVFTFGQWREQQLYILTSFVILKWCPASVSHCDLPIFPT